MSVSDLLFLKVERIFLFSLTKIGKKPEHTKEIQDYSQTAVKIGERLSTFILYTPHKKALYVLYQEYDDFCIFDVKKRYYIHFI